MILDSITKSLEVILAAVVATAQPVWYVAWADHTPVAFIPGAGDGLTNGTTAVTAVAAPTSGIQRQIKLFSLFNNDTAAVTATVRINNNAVLRIVVKITLAVGDTLEYDPSNGWKVITSSGFVKSGISPAGTTGEVQHNAGGGNLGSNPNLKWDVINNQLLLGNGSSANPILSFLNSIGLGFFRQATDVISLAFAGVERYRKQADRDTRRFDGAVDPTTFSNTAELQSQASSRPLQVLRNAFADAGSPGHIIRKSRGTLAAPEAVALGDNLYELAAHGHDGTAFANATKVLVAATEAWTGTAHGTKMRFQRPRNGQTALEDALEISETVADTETAILLQRNVGGTLTLQRVSMGAVDSGGAGFKLLRVAN